MFDNVEAKELAEEFYRVATNAAQVIQNVLYSNGCGYSTDYSLRKKGISIHFMFRNEVDYSILFPWEYIDDPAKIADYYNRFKEFTKDASVIPEIERMGEQFEEQELKKLGH